MATLSEWKASVIRQRRDMIDQAERAANLAERLLELPRGISEAERAQLETAAAKFRAVRAILTPICLNSLLPPPADEPDHEPIA